MSISTDERETGQATTDETPMFAATPVWERGRKRRATTSRATSDGSRTGVLVAVAAVVVGLGFAGAATWYALKDRPGVPELAAGGVEPAPTPPDLTAQIPPPAEPVAEPIEQAANELPPPEPARRIKTTNSSPAPKPHAASAGDTGVDASASAALPDQPVPYGELNPQPAPSSASAPEETSSTPSVLPEARPHLTIAPQPSPSSSTPPTD